jgi:pimeloyl-ACP methyl ester carboxylesterase
MKRYLSFVPALALALVATPLVAADASRLFERVEHHKVKSSDGVEIAYYTTGEGPTVLFVHGFPDQWLTWSHQMAALEDSYRVAAMDLRGYNRSGQPKEISAYERPQLLRDVMAVIDDLEVHDVTLVGHDWGGGISWRFAMAHPEKVSKLIICNLTHPRGYETHRLNVSAEEKEATMGYIDRLQSPDAAKGFSAERLASRWQHDPELHKEYLAGYRRSYFDGMINYYRAAYDEFNVTELTDRPQLKMPVLQIHGLDDRAVHHNGLRDTWNWIDADYTLVTLPGIGHNVQNEAAEVVSSTMRMWLDARSLNADARPRDAADASR